MKHLKFSFFCLIFACMVVALSNPQQGEGLEKGKRQGVDLMFCVDVSNSMLAQDYAPDRLSAVKQGLLSLVDKLQGDRIGLVLFAGKSFVQLPITSDYAAAKMFISNISTRSVSEQGTDLAGAIDKAAFSMLPDLKTGSQRDQVTKVMVIVSDGEDHAEDAVEMAKEAASQGILIYTLGIGSKTGEPIPEKRGNMVSYKKDNEGNTVITRLNEPLLMEIAKAGHGAYVHAANAVVSFDQLRETLDRLEKSDIDDVVYSRYNSKFYIPLLLALILLCVELLLTDKKMLRISESKWLNKKVLFLAFFFVFSVFVSQAQNTSELKALRQGNRNYYEALRLENSASKLQSGKGNLKQREAEEQHRKAQEKYAEATVNYLKANESRNDYYKSVYNLGDALYKQGRFDSAASKFEKVSHMTELDDRTRAKAYHNLGNSLMKQQNYQDAVNAYKQSLKLNPKDMDTKYNLEYAKRKLAVQQQQQQGQQQGQQNKDQQDKQQQQGQQNKDQQNQQQGQQNQNQGQQDKDRQDQHRQQAEHQRQAARNNEDKRQLEALQQNERHTQEKVKNAEAQGRPIRQDKDW